MDFEKAHGIFMHFHLRNRTGERRVRLERGHDEAGALFCQNVWWPRVVISAIYILNSRCWIGADGPITATLLSSPHI